MTDEADELHTRMVAFAVPGTVKAAGEARQRLAEHDGFVSADLRDDLLLLLTELVTNAVKHGEGARGAPVVVTVAQTQARVRVTVTDHGRAFSWQGRDAHRPESGGGYGLVLVDELATAWGIDGDRPTTVWFELELPT